jgi:hypothetical protein
LSVGAVALGFIAGFVLTGGLVALGVVIFANAIKRIW